jgi:geranylgeranyl pyrophosphate synthase
MPGIWPTSSEVHAAVAERVRQLLDEYGGLIADVGRRTLSGGTHVLSDQPHSPTTVLVPGACLAAGGEWQMAIWPTVGAECMMAAADVLDDVADADPGSETDNSGVLLTAAAGLLSLVGAAIVRVVDDGASPSTAIALVQMFGAEFAAAANGQANSLQSDRPIDALAAYRQAAAKSGPLGSLIARLGARTATNNPEIVEQLGQFGRHLAVRDQLLNDMRDAAPNPRRLKADVRAGTRTVPLVFSRSTGAPPGLDRAALDAWEVEERARIEASGGLTAAFALAEADRLQAAQALDTLEGLGCDVAGLRALIG